MTPHARTSWFRMLGLPAALLAIAVAIGLAMGRPWQALAIVALGVLGWQYWQLSRLLDRLAPGRRQALPAGTGAWSELHRQLHRRRVGMRARERRLLEMLRAYRAAAAALPDAVVVVDRNSQRIVWFNEASAPLLGMRYPDGIGAPLVQRLQPLPLAHWLAGGRNAEPLEATSPVDPATTLSLRLIPYSENLWLLVVRDVTRLLRLEQMRRDFVATVSHELRTPLTVIHGYLDMVDQDEHPEWKPVLSEMQRQSQRMTQLVEDLLTLSRLESRDTPPLEEPVSMTSILHTLKREALALSQGDHRVSIDDTAMVDLCGSGKELHSAFSNLVSNAVRYTPAGGDIVIRLRRAGDGLALEVRDSGYGIPAAHLPRITERFYRVSTSRSRESGGTGLGLAIVKHILNLHQARLEISSEVGRGSTFSCHFGPERILPREAGDTDSGRAEAHA